MENKKDQILYTIGEEIANAVTHGLGAGLSIAGLVILVIFSVILGDPWRVTSFAIYGGTMIALYLASTLYHGIQHPGAKRILQTIDHASIYLLIAGTYTPILLISLRGAWGWTLLGLIWGLALIGILFQVMSSNSKGKLGLITYLAMGWLSLVAMRELIIHVPPGGLGLLVVGGLFYTVGTLFYVWHKLPYNHAIWHLFVLAGSTSHFFAMLFHILPEQQI